MSERLKLSRERSRLRKELLKQTLGVRDLKAALGVKSVNVVNKPGLQTSEKKPDGQNPATSGPYNKRSFESLSGNATGFDRKLSWKNEKEGETNEEDEFRDSKAFLKGTQSLNPHNDYSQHFVDTGQRPQNFIRDVGLADRFEEYPKLRELIRLKNDLVSNTAHPPMYLRCDLDTFDLKVSLDQKFDVILIEPPLEEYARSHGVTNVKFWDWDKIMALDIAEISASRSFVFLWCGSSDGLDLGRLCLQSWGFRRCEDICWIQTNHKGSGVKVLEPNSVFQRTKEHCLMGIKGTVRRSTDGDFIHANVDIDLIIAEDGAPGSLDKPIEMFHIIEHFCLGKRRLQIFGRDSTIRPGWLTIGPDLSISNFDQTVYKGYFNDGNVTGSSERIEALRPKSPPPKTRERGRGRGVRGLRGSRGGR